MIHIVDNFLPTDQLIKLRDRIHHRYAITDKRQFPIGIEPFRISHNDEYGNWRKNCNFLGTECIPVIEGILNEFEKLNIRPVENWAVWFQYLLDNMDVSVHRDSELRQSNMEHTYSVLLYTSDWETKYGGQFLTGSPVYLDSTTGNSRKASDLKIETVIDPIPNRLVIWSRDTWHAVSKITATDKNYVRSLFGSSWSSVKDRETVKLVFDRST
jgi:hypothetical protein